MTRAIEKYQITIYSVVSGLFYLVLSIVADYGEGAKQAFMFLMLLLPGITFPIGTSYFLLDRFKHSELRIVPHFVLSALLYHGTVWVFSLEGRSDWYVILDGFGGSIIYLFFTFIIMKVRMKLWEMLVISTVSGLAFLPFDMIDNSITNCGIGVFVWTILNGAYLNYCKIRMLPK